MGEHADNRMQVNDLFYLHNFKGIKNLGFKAAENKDSQGQ